MTDKILAIDPSGTGTTGIFFADGKDYEFEECKEKEWRKHYDFIVSLVKAYQPNILLFEDTNYIHKKTKDGLNLFRLLGAIESLEVKEIKSVNVLRIKEISKKLLNGSYQIKDLEYLKGRGKGWMFKGERISIHQLEAFIVYYLWSKK